MTLYRPLSHHAEVSFALRLEKVQEKLFSSSLEWVQVCSLRDPDWVTQFLYEKPIHHTLHDDCRASWKRGGVIVSMSYD